MNYLPYVNIRQGTRSVPRFSQGNTLPLVQRPYGFAAFAPQTNSDRGCWFYHPDDRSFEGIRLTHQPSPWIGDYGMLTLTAQTECPYGTAWQSWSGINPEDAVLSPCYMKYALKRAQSLLELTPTDYGAWIRVSFQKDRENYISLLAKDQDYVMWFEAGKNRLHCHASIDRGHEHMEIFAVLEFPADAVDHSRCYGEDRDGKHTGFCENVLHRAYHLAAKQKSFIIRMAVSYISDSQAVLNLERESHYESFGKLKEENEKIWNETLGKIEIQADEETMRTFYSCMYRAALFPHRAYELDLTGNPVHYAPACREVRPGYRYTDNGFWDTYRTVYPFLSIVDPDLYREILEGYIRDYQDSGWLPRWTAGVACCCMPGTAIDAVIADAAVKGILKGGLLETAFQGMEKHASEPSSLPEYGRSGIEEFEKRGYMPCDLYDESVNLTLDASYFDFCIGETARVLGKKDREIHYKKRAQNYRNLFDRETGFMRGKDSRGVFRPGFDPCRWGFDYTEAAAWQTTFAVQHDLEGLAELMGGREAFLQKLDRLFETEPGYSVGSYRQEIHEMTEMAACDWGQCALSNQPSFHIPYLYAYFGEPQKAAYWIRRACREGFSWKDDGFPGDEDNGSMALYYVFAVLGIYPICPGRPIYTHIEPLTDSVKIHGRKVDLGKFGNLISHRDLMEEIYR